MPDPLELECRAYVRHLTGGDPTGYVIRKYRECHEKGEPFCGAGPDWLDRMLLRLARKGRLGATLADSYATRLRPRSLLRKKQVLVLALLECTPPFCDCLDTPGAGTRAGAAAQMGLAAAADLLAFAVSVAVLGPLHLAWAVRRRMAR